MTKTKALKFENKDYFFRYFYLAAVVFTYLFGLGAVPFLGPDEPRYAQVAREMLERNDFITPTLGNFNWFEKPALLYWLEIIAYKLFGVSEYTARLGSAVFGLLTAFTIYLLCRFVTKNQAPEAELQTSNDFPAWAFLVSATSGGLLIFSRAASFDIVLTFPVTAALASFFVAETVNSKSKNQNFKWLFSFYFFIGVALLAKGLVGVVLPFGIIFTYFLFARKFPHKNVIFSLFWGFLITLAVAALWYAPIYWRHGWTFVDEFFIQHHFARYTSNKYAHPEPFYFFWLILPALALPWTPFLIAGIWQFFKGQKIKDEKQKTNFTIFALAWLIFPLIFFSFSGSKLPGYILPALPGALILSAEQASFFAQKSKRAKNILLMIAFLTLATIVTLTFFAESFTRKETQKSLISAADARGLTSEKVLNLHDISHSLEFYAAGRVVRKPDGNLRQFFGAGDILEFLKQTGEERVLVIVPLERLHELFDVNYLKSETIADNGEYAIVVVSR